MRKKKEVWVIRIHRTNIHNKKKKEGERENYKHHKKKGGMRKA